MDYDPIIDPTGVEILLIEGVAHISNAGSVDIKHHEIATAQLFVTIPQVYFTILSPCNESLHLASHYHRQTQLGGGHWDMVVDFKGRG